MNLASIKNDLGMLCGALGVDPRRHKHVRCAFCPSSDALAIRKGERGYFYRCFSCGASGDIVTAVSELEGIGPGKAIRKLTGEDYKPSAIRPVRVEREPLPPRINRKKANALHLAAHEATINGFADRWLAKRGIRRDFIEVFPNLAAFAEGRWLIRITDAAGNLLALKGHREGGAWPQGVLVAGGN